MNIIFWLLIAIFCVSIWVLLSAIFIPLGKLVYTKWKKLNDKLNKEYEEEKEKDNNEIR